MRGDKITAPTVAGGSVRDVFIAGAGQTPVTKDHGVRGRYLGAATVQAALADAGIASAAVGALFVGNMLSGILSNQQQLGGVIADYSGLAGVEAVTIEAACASGGAAARMAYLAVAGGIHDVVAVCGVERMTHVERDTVTRALATAADWELEGVSGESFLSLNAGLMRAYMDKYGVAAERFAPFAINAHRNALTNPNALLHKAVDLDTYRTSRIVADPIRLFDVSPICNGAAALVFVAPHLAANANARIRIAGSALATAPLALSRRADALRLTAVESSTQRALRQAGVGHADIDLFEPHDAYTIMTALTLEAAGFAAPGKGLDWAHEERIGLSGDLPLTTFGGLKARGHPVGASGCYQLVEAFLQLTERAGENQVPDAGVALVQNIGGTGATVASHVLIRDA
jgi:acetyl-CoA C-acetyltransferase